MNDYPMMQDLSGIAPTMQNTLAQQQMIQQMMQQGNQLSNQALGNQQSGGMNPMDLAKALRKDNSMLSTAQNQEIRKLGSNPSNMMSGYNTGMFGWGNYGE
jgi:hypothetical protein